MRSANLARIYNEAGLDDVSLREASRAVAADYGNYSAHLFLANSYEQLRQASPFDLRFETPAFSEYLVASLLGPADGRILAQPVTQQEYTRLFERDTIGFSSSTEYLSRGAWSQYAAQYGTFRNSSYAVETSYRSDPGETPNGFEEMKQVSLKLKQMLTPRDGLFFQVMDFHREAGDLAQRYDPRLAVRGLNLREKQEPDFLLGLNHQWQEGQNTLFLASRFNDSTRLSSPSTGTFLLTVDFVSRRPDNFLPVTLAQNYQNRQTVDSFEVQHLMKQGGWQTIAGIRVQEGTDRMANDQTIHNGDAVNFETYFGPEGTLITNQSLRIHTLRFSPYLYEHWQIAPPLLLIAGVSYDYLRQPRNVLFAPLDAGTEIRRQFSPKAALVWRPGSGSTVRAAWSRSLGGVDLDQSVRLEPTQLAGFVQAYRNVFPDSIVGGISGASLENADISLEQQFSTGTYLAVAGQWLGSKSDHDVGAFAKDFFHNGPGIQVRERLRFDEYSLDLALHQLVSDCLSFGVRYRLSDARLSQTYPGIDPSFPGNPGGDMRGLLHHLSLSGLFRHPSGFFAGVEASWWKQHLGDTLATTMGDAFWQVNLNAGYRFPNRHAEISVGLLNVGGRDYHLHPINLYPSLACDRTLMARLELNF